MVTEFEFGDVHDPKYTYMDLWIGNTATSDNAVEISVSSLLNMQLENLSCTISKANALKLAEAIINHFEGVK